MPQLINAERLKTIESNFNTIYGETMKKKKTWMDPCVQTFQAKSYILTDIWPAQMPPLRRMNGGRVHRNVSLIDTTKGNTLSPKTTVEWESTVDVKRRDILADNLGVYVSAVTDAAARTVQHADQLASLALLNGTTTHNQNVCFDGKAVFATDHDLDPTRTQSNLLSGSLTQDNFAAALETALQWTGNEGVPLLAGEDELPILVVPPQLKYTAISILENPGIATSDAISKPWSKTYKQADLIVNPYLREEPDAWYILFPMNGVAPIAYYQFIAPEFQIRMDLSDPIVYETQNFSFGAFADDHAFIPAWFTALKSKPTANTYTGTNIKESIV